MNPLRTRPLRPQQSPITTRAADADGSTGPIFDLTADLADERLDVFLARRVAGLTRSAAQQLVEGERVTVAGRVEKCSFRLAPGDEVHGERAPIRPSALVPEPMHLSIIYEDADVIVVDKPAGLVVHPSAGHDAGTLVHGLLALESGFSGIGGELRPGIVHRLDKDTSGLLLVAKHDAAHINLVRQFEQRTVDKRYLALVRGVPQPPEGVVDAPIGRHPVYRQKMAISVRGRQARTRYRLLSQCGGHSLLVAALETGRTHQLRVHFSTMGCPIAGDPIYGTSGGPAGRLWLHAWRLTFARPSDGAAVSLEAPLPSELVAGWASLAARARGGKPDLDELLQAARRWARAPRSIVNAVHDANERQDQR